MFKTVLTMLLAVVSAATCTPAPAADLGIHLGTYHTRHGVYNNANPGVYARADNGLTAGVYLNSLSKVSTYAGWTTSTQAGPVELSLTLGGITGYPGASVLPLAVPSAAIKVDEATSLRLTWIPRVHPKVDTHAFHVAIETKF